jgi:hypothetical protein
MSTVAIGSTSPQKRAQPAHRLVRRLGLLVAVTLSVALMYAWVIQPWHMHWGATPAEIQQTWPGDQPTAPYVTTRAVTIDAPPEAIWPWIVQMGQGRGGLYSYEVLENLAGSDLHNADRIHPEWQHLAVGDVIRPVPDGYLGLADSPEYTVAAIEPNHFLILDGFATFVLDQIDEQTTRLIVRGSSTSPFESMEPFNFIMGRRMLLGVKERAEGTLHTSALDIAEVLSWMLAFAASVIAGIWVLVRRAWLQPLALLVAAIASLLLLLFWRPPLWAGGLLDVSLIVALVWTERTRHISTPEESDNGQPHFNG